MEFQIWGCKGNDCVTCCGGYEMGRTRTHVVFAINFFFANLVNVCKAYLNFFCVYLYFR